MSEPLQFRGEIIHVGPLEKVGASGFRKRLVVVSDGNDKYPQKIPFELTGERAEMEPRMGMATVKFYLQGREWNGKYYSSLRAVEITSDDAAPIPSKPAQPAAEQAATGDDDLPF